MLTPHTEKRILQLVVLLGCLVPITAGLAGAIQGTGTTPLNIDLDNHYRYLSGLLLGIGFGFLSTIPNIERHHNRILLLTIIVFTGGICRLAAAIFIAAPTTPIMQAALIMELVITPLICVWQHHIAKRFIP